METSEKVFVPTRKYSDFVAGQDLLTDLAMSGQLTAGLLDEAMKALYDDGDFIEQSIGFAWILSKPGLFMPTAARLGIDITAFLLKHASVCWVGSRILLSTALLNLIPQEEREQFVQTVYSQYGACKNSWLGVVTAAGVPLSTVCELIFARLEAVSDNCELSCTSNAVQDFLRDHGPTYTGDMHWGLFNDKQFSEEMRWLAEWRPECFIAQRVFLEGRLGKERYRALAASTQARRNGRGSRLGAGWEPTQWAALNDAQFLHAMAICARKSPSEFFAKRQQIGKRIGKDAFKNLALLVTDGTRKQL